MALSSGEAVHEALVLAGQLTVRPDSLYAAALAGGPQFFGWDDARYLAADTRDVLFLILSSLGGQKASPEDLYPRPTKAEEEPQEAATIADFNPGTFIRWLMS